MPQQPPLTLQPAAHTSRWCSFEPFYEKTWVWHGPCLRSSLQITCPALLVWHLGPCSLKSSYASPVPCSCARRLLQAGDLEPKCVNLCCSASNQLSRTLTIPRCPGPRLCLVMRRLPPVLTAQPSASSPPQLPLPLTCIKSPATCHLYLHHSPLPDLFHSSRRPSPVSPTLHSAARPVPSVHPAAAPELRLVSGRLPVASTGRVKGGEACVIADQCLPRVRYAREAPALPHLERSLSHRRHLRPARHLSVRCAPCSPRAPAAALALGPQLPMPAAAAAAVAVRLFGQELCCRQCALGCRAKAFDQCCLQALHTLLRGRPGRRGRRWRGRRGRWWWRLCSHAMCCEKGNQRFPEERADKNRCLWTLL